MTERGATVLYDVPGPRARLRNNALTLAFGVVLLLVAYFVWTKFDEKGQWDGKLWQPFLRADTWTELILPGLLNTLAAAAVAAVLALLFGAVFGIARLSDHRWVRIPAAVVVEAFRAVPVLMLIFFAQYGGSLAGLVVTEFAAVVFGLTVYNGSVLAEIVRAGILAVPRGQAEAGSAIGLRKNQVMRLILLPQAVTAMMPAIVSQLVVLLKDTALGFVVAYADLLNAAPRGAGQLRQPDPVGHRHRGGLHRDQPGAGLPRHVAGTAQQAQPQGRGRPGRRRGGRGRRGRADALTRRARGQRDLCRVAAGKGTHATSILSACGVALP